LEKRKAALKRIRSLKNPNVEIRGLKDKMGMWGD
jgi:hypothetical protein